MARSTPLSPRQVATRTPAVTPESTTGVGEVPVAPTGGGEVGRVEAGERFEHGKGPARPSETPADPKATAAAAGARVATLWQQPPGAQELLARFDAHLADAGELGAEGALRTPPWPAAELTRLVEALVARGDAQSIGDGMTVVARLVGSAREQPARASAEDLALRVLVAAERPGVGTAAGTLAPIRALNRALEIADSKNDALTLAVDRAVLKALPGEVERDLTRAEAAAVKPELTDADVRRISDMTRYWWPVVRQSGRVETDDLLEIMERAETTLPNETADVTAVVKPMAARLYALDERVTPTPSALSVAERWSLLSIARDAPVAQVDRGVAALEAAIDRREARFANRLGGALGRVWSAERSLLSLVESLGRAGSDALDAELPQGVSREDLRRLSARLDALEPSLSSLRVDLALTELRNDIPTYPGLAREAATRLRDSEDFVNNATAAQRTELDALVAQLGG